MHVLVQHGLGGVKGVTPRAWYLEEDALLGSWNFRITWPPLEREVMSAKLLRFARHRRGASARRTRRTPRN
ncbi:MAG: hypothetical protein O2816_00555 [Planctomycetota bacterium]|nr:hypothetical protein [Planctomycetota bacterium]